MAINAPTATQSNTPLLYKGVFSTRKNTRNKSIYNYMHDKLHHIKFLGLGTYDGSVDSDLMIASYIRLNMSGIGVEETYEVAQCKYKESLVGEGLRGKTRFEGIRDSLLTNKSGINMADKLSKLNKDIERELTFARLFNSMDIVKEEIIKKLEEIKQSFIDIEGIYERTDLVSIEVIIEGVEELEKKIKEIDTSETPPLIFMERIKVKDLNLLKEEILKKAQYSIDGNERINEEILLIKVPKPVESTSGQNLVEADVFKDLCKSTILNYVDLARTARTSELIFDEIMDIAEIELASILLFKVVTDKISYGDLLGFDYRLLDKIVKEAVIVQSTLSLIEIKASEIIIDAFIQKGIILEPKIGALIHYKLMKDDRLYKGKIQDEISKYLKALGMRLVYLNDIQSEVGEIVLNNTVFNDVYLRATKILQADSDLVYSLASTVIEQFEESFYKEFGKNFIGNIGEEFEVKSLINGGELIDSQFASATFKDTGLLKIIIEAFKQHKANKGMNTFLTRLDNELICNNQYTTITESFSIAVPEYNMDNFMLYSKVIKDLIEESTMECLPTFDKLHQDYDMPMARDNNLAVIGKHSKMIPSASMCGLEHVLLFDMTREAIRSIFELIIAGKHTEKALIDNQICASMETLKIDSIESIIAHKNIWKCVREVLIELESDKPLIDLTVLNDIIGKLTKLADEFKSKDVIIDRANIRVITDSILSAIKAGWTGSTEINIINSKITKILEDPISIWANNYNSSIPMEEHNHLLLEDISKVKDSELLLTHMANKLLKSFEQQKTIDISKLRADLLIADIKVIVAKSLEEVAIKKELEANITKLATGYKDLSSLITKVIETNSIIDSNGDFGKQTNKRQKNTKIDISINAATKNGLDMLIQHIETLSREYKGLGCVVEAFSSLREDTKMRLNSLLESQKITGYIDLIDTENLKKLIIVKGKVDRLLDEIGIGASKLQKALLDSIIDGSSNKSILNTLLENIKVSIGNILNDFAVIQDLTYGDSIITSNIFEIMKDIVQHQNKASHKSYLDDRFMEGSSKSNIKFNILDIDKAEILQKGTHSKPLEELVATLEPEVVEYSKLILGDYSIGNKVLGDGGNWNENILYGTNKRLKESKSDLRLIYFDKLNIQINTAETSDIVGLRCDEIQQALIDYTINTRQNKVNIDSVITGIEGTAFSKLLPLKSIIETMSIILYKSFQTLEQDNIQNVVIGKLTEMEQGVIAHTYLYDCHKAYKSVVIEALNAITNSQVSSLGSDIDLVEVHQAFVSIIKGSYDNFEELGTALIDEYAECNGEQLAITYPSNGLIEKLQSALSGIKTKVEQAMDARATRIKIDNPAKFDFEHQLVDAESKDLEAVLEYINSSIIRTLEEFYESTDMVFSPSNYKQTLLTESLEYNQIKDTRKVEIYSEEATGKDIAKEALLNKEQPTAEDSKRNINKQAVKHFEAIEAKKIQKNLSTIDLTQPTAEFGENETTYHHWVDTELQGELIGNIEYNYPSEEPDVWGELVTKCDDNVQISNIEKEYLSELTNSITQLKPIIEPELFGESTNGDITLSHDTMPELFGEYSDSDKPLSPTLQSEIFSERISINTRKGTATTPETWADRELENNAQVGGHEEGKGKEVTNRPIYDKENEHEIAVFSCTSPKLKLRKRDNLKPEPKPEEPVWEWSCEEGYICDDWLIVPLKDFDFEHSEQGFFDPNTFKPYYPTGKYDNKGNPYILAPYAVLNEPISNGVDVGGKEPMFINPCNLYSAIKYLIKIYDSYKPKFIASDPVAVMSRILNMLFERIQEINSAWTTYSDYTPDEMWRIYRFIRWMAIGIMNRFYRLKLVYIWGDWIENFDSPSFIINPAIKLSGASVKIVPTYGQVLEGHPIHETITNSAWVDFEVPEHISATTINFEMGNVIPDRPPYLGGEYHWRESFEGSYSGFKIKGEGWVKTVTAGGYGLGVEDPAKPQLYKTDIFTIPQNIAKPITLDFDWGVLTNMEGDIEFRLMRNGVQVASQSAPSQNKHVVINNAEYGDYHFEIEVTESEVGLLEPIHFPAIDIQNNWTKGGYHTNWEVEESTIYEEENTMGVAIVYNQAWLNDMDYEFTGEFMTDLYSDSIKSLRDWLGFVFNVKDENNYYAVGAWANFNQNGIPDGGFCGIWKVVNGNGRPSEGVAPTWKIGNGNLKWEYNQWYKVKIRVKGNVFQIDLNGLNQTITDSNGWGYGASGLAAYSNPYSTFRNVTYKSKPAFNAYIDNVNIESPGEWIPTPSPHYYIDFYLDSAYAPSIAHFSELGKQSFSFPILKGDHRAKWVYRKDGQERSVVSDASFIDNIAIKGITIVDAKVEEEFIGCGGHMSARLLIQNLLEYYRKHHQGCHGHRDIWIVE